MGSRKIGQPRRKAEQFKQWRVNGIRVSVDTYTGQLTVDGDGSNEDKNAVTAWVRDTLSDAGFLVDAMTVRDRLFKRGA